MDMTQQRLSTGKKVNSALDNPNSYFQSQSLTDRANDLSGLLDGMGQAIQVLTTANQGITSAESIIEQMKSVATSAAQSVSGTNASSTVTLSQTGVLGTLTAATAKLTTGDATHSLLSLMAGATTTSAGVQNGDQLTIQLNGSGTTGNTYTFTVGASNANNGTVADGGGSTLADLSSWVSGVTGGNVAVTVAAGKVTLTDANASASSDTTIGGQLATDLTLTPGALVNGTPLVGATALYAANVTTAPSLASSSTMVGDVTDGTDAGLLNVAGQGTGYANSSSTLTIGTTNIAVSSSETVGQLVSSINSQSSTTGVTANFDTSVSGQARLSLTNSTGTAVAISGSASGLFGTTSVAANTTTVNTNDLYAGMGTSVSTNPTLSNVATVAGEPRLATNDILYITQGTTTSSVTLTAGMTANDLINKVNAVSGLSASYNSSTGAFGITSTTGQNLSFSGTVADKIGLASSSSSSAAVSASYTTQFDTLRTQLDQLVADASYQGVNLLSGNGGTPLTVTFNEAATNANKLTVNAVDLTTTGLGITQATGNWTNTAAIQSTLTTLTNAETTMRTTASALGQNLTTVQTRQDFTNQMINTLQAGSDSLTNADMNAESANMLALQTRQQLGIQALSLSSQANQAVMRLFG
jgi:flagellin-like hook-associated protein FlgL